MRSALLEGVITYKGTGEEFREYIHVCDAARASVDILQTEFQNQHIVITGPSCEDSRRDHDDQRNAS